MEVTSTLLVAIMFTVVLSIGIGNLLMGLASLVNRRSGASVYWVHAAWLVLLLLVYCSIFWDSVGIFSVEDWGFLSFLYVITGPILLLFATNVLVPEASPEDSGDLKGLYFSVGSQFFIIMALVQAWGIGSELLLKSGLTSSSGFNAVAGVILLVLAVSSSTRIHALGVLVAFLLFILVITLRALGVS